MIDLQQFKMNPAEESLLSKLVLEQKPQRIAEFGCGLTTRLWAEKTEASIVTWDNYPEWVAGMREAFFGAPWLPRIDFRIYEVAPDGGRAVEKTPVSWEGEKFDFLFLDGPRSAHPSNFGRSGSFRFATLHAAPGALIVWHDAERPHEREMGRHYFPHCARRRLGRIGWCRWEPRTGGLRQLWNRCTPFA